MIHKELKDPIHSIPSTRKMCQMVRGKHAPGSVMILDHKKINQIEQD